MTEQFSFWNQYLIEILRLLILITMRIFYPIKNRNTYKRCVKRLILETRLYRFSLRARSANIHLNLSRLRGITETRTKEALCWPQKCLATFTMAVLRQIRSRRQNRESHEISKKPKQCLRHVLVTR